MVFITEALNFNEVSKCFFVYLFLEYLKNYRKYEIWKAFKECLFVLGIHKK